MLVIGVGIFFLIKLKNKKIEQNIIQQQEQPVVQQQPVIQQDVQPVVEQPVVQVQEENK